MKKQHRAWVLVCAVALLLPVLLLQAVASPAEGQTGEDLMGVFAEYTVSQPVDGDVLLVANTLDVNAQVNGSIRSVATTVTLSGKVVRNVTAAAMYAEMTEGFSAGNVYLAGDQVIFAGSCETLSVYASTVIIGGSISGDVSVTASEVILLEDAVFGGQVNISSDAEPVVAKTAQDTSGVRLSDSVFAGKVNFHKQQSNTSYEMLMSLLGVLANVLLAIVLLFLFKRKGEQSSVSLNRSPVPFVLKGFGAVVLLPLPILFLLIIPITSLLGVVLLLLYILALVLSTAASAVLLGRLWLSKLNPYLSVALAALAIGVLRSVPFIGGIVGFACVALSFGFVVSLLFAPKQVAYTAPEDPQLRGDMDFRV